MWASPRIFVAVTKAEEEARKLQNPLLPPLEEEIGGGVDMALDRGAQLQQRAVLELTDAFLRDTELAAELLERRALLAQPALGDDRALPRAQLAQGKGEPARARLAVAQPDDDVLGVGPRVGEEILPV